MAQTQAGAGRQDEDPVLVRPYVGTGGPDATTGTWPDPAATAEQPAVEGAGPAEAATARQPAAEDGGPAEAATARQPAAEDGGPGNQATGRQAAAERGTAAPRERSGLPVRLRAAILVAGVGLAVGVAAYLVLGFGVDQQAPVPSTALPAIDGRIPIGSAAAGSTAPSASVSRPVSPSPSTVAASATRQSLVPVPPSGATSAPPSPAPPAAEPTLSSPPAARTGQITGAGGRCLALGGLLGLDGSPVQVAGCRGGSAQTFTLATDGTLRVGGRCARATGDGTVRVGGCGEDPAGQWRTGPAGTLVNASGDGCLTDPGRSGATTRVTACSGAAEQTWTLP